MKRRKGVSCSKEKVYIIYYLILKLQWGRITFEGKTYIKHFFPNQYFKLVHIFTKFKGMLHAYTLENIHKYFTGACNATYTH